MGGIAILIYAFFKSRKNRGSARGSSLIYRKGSASVSSPTNDLMTLLMIQAILDQGSYGSQYKQSPIHNENHTEKNEMERLKQEVLALFGEE